MLSKVMLTLHGVTDDFLGVTISYDTLASEQLIYNLTFNIQSIKMSILFSRTLNKQTCSIYNALIINATQYCWGSKINNGCVTGLWNKYGRVKCRSLIEFIEVTLVLLVMYQNNSILMKYLDKLKHKIYSTLDICQVWIIMHFIKW